MNLPDVAGIEAGPEDKGIGLRSASTLATANQIQRIFS
jgi:hypothetical protein